MFRYAIFLPIMLACEPLDGPHEFEFDDGESWRTEEVGESQECDACEEAEYSTEQKNIDEVIGTGVGEAVVVNREFTGSRRNHPIVGPGSVFDGADETCATTTATWTASWSNSSGAQGGLEIGLPGVGAVTFGGSTSGSTGGSQGGEFEWCESVSNNVIQTTTHPQTACTLFNGVVTETFEARTFEIVQTTNWHRKVLKCRSNTIHVCTGYLWEGEWTPGPTTVWERTLPDPIVATVSTPTIGWRCEPGTTYPTMPN